MIYMMREQMNPAELFNSLEVIKSNQRLRAWTLGPRVLLNYGFEPPFLENPIRLRAKHDHCHHSAVIENIIYKLWTQKERNYLVVTQTVEKRKQTNIT